MQHPRLYGARLSVMGNQGGLFLGYGTYIGEVYREAGLGVTPRILLDTGECIFGHQCIWTEMNNLSPLRPFDHVHRHHLRLFVPAEGQKLRLLQKRLSRGSAVRILGFSCREWEHYLYVAAQIMIGPNECFALANELEFPLFGHVS